MTLSVVNTAREEGRTFVNTGIAHIPADIVHTVGRGEIRCPICDRDSDFISARIRKELRNDNGDISHNIGPCECELYRTFWRKFRNAVPAHDRHISLDALTPSDKSKLPNDVQEKVIADLKENPGASYAFFGPAGTSKTTYTVALFGHALFNAVKDTWDIPMWQPHKKLAAECVWRISAKTLLDQFVAAATGEGAPAVNRAKIIMSANAGFTPCLFIEEIDKVKYTEFKTNALFEVIDAIYENNGQLVINSNLPRSSFHALFSEETGPAIVRRIGELCRGNVIDFFGAH